MPGTLPKDARSQIPFCDDQGMANIMGCPRRGQSIQRFQAVVPGAAVQVTINFAAAGGVPMADALYTVMLTNHTTQGTGLSLPANRTAQDLIVTSVAAADVIEVLVIGPVAGQLH